MESIVGIIMVAGGAHRCLNRRVRKTTLLQKPHLFCTLCGVSRWIDEFFSPNLASTGGFILGQASLDAAQFLAINAMRLQLGKNPVVAKPRSTAMYEGFGKAGLGQEFGGFERIKQSFYIVTFLRIAGKLASQFQPAVFSSR